MTSLKIFVRIALGCTTAVLVNSAAGVDKSDAPEGVRYRSIKINEPQLFVDDYLVGNRYNEEYISARVPHVLHRGTRLPDPVLTKDDDKPWERRGVWGGSALYDAYADLFRMYYVIYNPEGGKSGYGKLGENLKEKGV